MPGPTTTLLIEGSFSELVEEFANYIDSLRKDDSLKSEIAPLLQPIRQQEQSEGEPDQKQNDEVLKKLVAAATALNGAPEKGEWEYPQNCGQTGTKDPPSNIRPRCCKILGR